MKKEKNLEMMVGDIKIEKCQDGICEGAIETYVEKYLREWNDLIVIGEGTTNKGSPRRRISYKGGNKYGRRKQYRNQKR